MKPSACLLLGLLACTAHAAEPETLFQPADLARLAELSEPGFAPDGKHLAYTVTSANLT